MMWSKCLVSAEVVDATPWTGVSKDPGGEETWGQSSPSTWAGSSPATSGFLAEAGDRTTAPNAGNTSPLSEES